MFGIRKLLQKPEPSCASDDDIGDMAPALEEPRAEIVAQADEDAGEVNLGIELLQLNKLYVSWPYRKDGKIADIFGDLEENKPDVRSERAAPKHNDATGPDENGYHFTSFTQVTATELFQAGTEKIFLLWLHTPDFRKLRSTKSEKAVWVAVLLREDNTLIGRIEIDVEKVQGGFYQTSILWNADRPDALPPLKLEKFGDLKYRIRKAVAEDRISIEFAH